MNSSGIIQVKINLNDYLIPATEAKRFKGLYYIRAEKEYTGDLEFPRVLMYTLEKCRSKNMDDLVSEYWKRTPLYKCWIVKPDCRIQEYWTRNGELPDNFIHVETKEEIKKFMEMALKFF